MSAAVRGAVTALALALTVADGAAEEEVGQAEDDELTRAHQLLDAPGGEGFEYSADRFVDYVEGDSILLEGNAVVRHRGARLEATRMVYLRDRQLVIARAGVDSSGQRFGLPTLTRGQDVLEGESILYEIDSGEGVISDGRIGHDDGFYAGERIRTRSEQEFLVRSGLYTTCDNDTPHFDFYSPRIKVLVGEMAIARPVYFRIGERKLFVVPFYVFSLREDRQSGLLTPGFGRRPVSFGSTVTEWEVRDLGYYFAPSDYWDLTLSADLRQRSGWLARSALAYAWRYRFDGRLETRTQSFQSGDRTSWSWWLSGSHRQDLGPSASVRASGTFQSNRDFLRDNGTALGDRLNRTLRSNVRYDKRWREAGWSLSTGASQTKNLDTKRSDVVLPEISLRSNRKSLFGSPSGSGSTSSGAWYTRIYYDGNARLRNTRRKTTATGTEQTSGNASLRLSSQQRPASWVNVNTGWGSSWRDTDLRDGDDEGVRTDQLSVSATASQTVYGLFYPRLGRVHAVRHVLKPDAGFAFSATRADTGGVGFGGRVSDWRASRRLTLRLANTFWAKLLGREGDDDEVKHRLAQLNLSTSYDFDRDERPLSDLVTSLTIDAGRSLKTRWNLRSEFYDDDDDLLATPRIRQFEVNSSMRLTSRPGGAAAEQEEDAYEGEAAGRPSTYGAGRTSGEFGYERGLQRDIDRRGRGRRLQVSHYYSWRRSSFGDATRRSWLRTSLGGSVRRVWHVDYSLSYNLGEQSGAGFLDTERVTAELLSVQREFHDWTATFNIEPSRFAEERTFYFKAQFKDIPQIRFERGDRRRIG